MSDLREEVAQELCISLQPYITDINKTMNVCRMVLDRYEMTPRTTEVAECLTDRNQNLIRRFIIAKTVKGCTEKTVDYYRAQLESIIPAIGETVDDVTADDIRHYLAVRQMRDGISATTANNELRVLKSFFAWLCGEEIISKNPTLRVDPIKNAKRKKPAFTNLDIEKIRDACRDERERAVVECLLSTGCRVSELVQIRLDDIDGGKVLVHGKGNKDRYVYLNERACYYTEKYLSLRKDDNPYLFAGGIDMMFERSLSASPKGKVRWWTDPRLVTETHYSAGGIESMVRDIGRRAGVEKVHPHRFRRTCATMALRQGMPLEQVSKMLGHESLATTQIYLDLREDELETAHRKYVV